LCSNSCTSLQTAAAVLKRSPETSPHKTRRHTQPNSKQCSRNILHQRQIVLKLLPDPSNSCCCCMPISSHSRHIPHRRQIVLNSCPRLQCAAAATSHSGLVQEILNIGERVCSNARLRFQTEKPAACYSALVRHIFHTCERLYPNARLCLQSVAPAASHSGLVREKPTLVRDGASTIARAFNLQLLLHTTQASFATYSTSARYCVHMKHYSAAAASHSAPIHNTLHIGERLCANARPSL
jgi:hypothetical protein